VTAAAKLPRVTGVRRAAAGARTATAWETAAMASEQRSGRGRELAVPCEGSRAPTRRTGQPASPSAWMHPSASPVDSNKWRPVDGTSSWRGLRCHGSPLESADSDCSEASRRASAALEWHCAPVEPT